MHLTLRTLLAYLDDNLDPEETRRIGDKVAHSAQARDLVGRIATVLRRRRLLAPDADPKLADLDANLVAQYLDNSLDEDLVARLERLCLDDDTTLAEVAATHQILSRSLSDPAEFSDEARRKAYAAVGVNATAPTSMPPIGPAPPAAAPPPAKPTRRARDFVRPLGLAALAGCALLAARQAYLPPETPPAGLARQDRRAAAAEPKPVADPAPEPAPAPAAVEKDSAPPVAPPPPALAKALPETPAPMPVPERVPPPAPMRPAGPPLAPEPAGPPQATYDSARGVLLRRLPGGAVERLQTGAKLAAEAALLVNLDGSRSLLTRPDRSALEFVDQARALAHADDSAAFRLLEGRVVLRAADQATSFVIAWEQDRLRLEAPNGHAVATVVLLPRALDAAADLPATLLVNAADGAWRLRRGDEAFELPAGREVDVGAGRPWGALRAEPAPNWLAGTSLSAAEAKAAEALGQRGGIPFGTQGTTLALQRALRDRQRETRRLAVRGLAALEESASLVDALGDPQFADNRSNATLALRAALRFDPAGADAVAKALQSSFGNAEAAELLALLRGLPPAAARDPVQLQRLVQLLENDGIAARELAGATLRELFGKDYGFNAADAPARRANAVRLWRLHLGDRK